ncbi:MAG: hypothetical protein V1716_05720 [Candidatus Uhrbacteria bacterium]
MCQWHKEMIMTGFPVDLSQLSDKPTIYKAVGQSVQHGVGFGTLYLCTRGDAETGWGTTTLERHHPDVVEFLMRGCKDIELPGGWKQDSFWVSDDFHFAASFVTHWFEVPFEIAEFTNNGGRIPTEVGLLLSGYLQLGEAVNARNFDNYRRLKGLKFLPLVITPTGIRFYMYCPSSETMRAAIVRFQEVLDRLRGIMRAGTVRQILRDMYATVLLSQAEEVLEKTPASVVGVTEVEGALRSRLDTYMKCLDMRSGSLGSVYQDLKPGPHDARHFFYGLLVRH